MSENEKTPKFPKLKDDNYVTWSIMMEAELIRKGLWTNIVEILVDTEDKTEEEIEEAIEGVKMGRKAPKLAEARAEIILRVEPSQLAHMRDRDPMEIWNSLRTVHQARGFATSLALRRRFLTAKKSVTQSMQSWIGDIQAQAFLMEEAGIDVSDQDKILALTMGLPDTYSAVIINFDSTPADQLTFDHVIIRLLNEETRQAALPSTEAAFTTHVKSKSRRPLSEITCFNCQKKGNYKSDCPDLKKTTAAIATEDADEIW